jgi:hypothetical protein
MDRLIITECASAGGCLKRAKLADKIAVTWPQLLAGPLPSDAETAQIFDPDFASDLAPSERAFPLMWLRPVWRTPGSRGSRPELGLKDVCRLFDTIELWFDPVAESQLALMHLLDYLKGDADLTDRMVLVHLDRRLGDCTPEAAVGLRPPRTSVDGRTVAVASRIWSAWRQPAPLDFARLLDEDTSDFPHMRSVIWKLLEELPAADTALGATETSLLRFIDEGAATYLDVLARYANGLWPTTYGSLDVDDLLEALCCAPRPALSSTPPIAKVAIDDPDRFVAYHPTALSLSDLGRDLLERRADYADHNPIHRWWGGVELTNARLWRWDAAKRSVVEPS